jgi:hypothetical protein
MTVTLELSPEREAALMAQARARGLTIEQWLLHLAEQSGPVPVSEAVEIGQEEHDARPIWQKICDRMRNVPPEDLAALPKDGASQIDHYVYGLHKREQ